MTKEESFRKTVAWLAIASAVFGIGNFSLTGIAGGGDPSYLSNLYAFIGAGGEAGAVMKWAWLSDMLGYYVLLLPVAFLLHSWLRSEEPYWMSVITALGLGYIICGTMGASILARTWPTLLSGFEDSQGLTADIYRIVFVNTTEAVYGALWGYLEFLIGGLWWFGVGLVLKRIRRALGVATVAVGAVTLTAALGQILAMDVVANVAFMAYLGLAPAWAVGLGLVLLRDTSIRLAARE